MKLNDKKNLGIFVYYTSLILAFIGIVLIILLIGIEFSEEQTIKRYFWGFYIIAFVLSGGALCRELFVLDFDKKKLIIKFIVFGALLIIGTIINILVKNSYVGLILLIVSIVSYLYMLAPTKLEKTNKNI